MSDFGRADSTSRSATIRVGGQTVHRLGLGTNRLTGTLEGRAVLRQAVELGVDFIDTADVYQSGASEDTIGEVIPPSMDHVLVATKGGMVRTAEGSGTDARPAHLREAFEGSLRRLHRDRIDLYQLHRVDPRTPIEESLAVLLDFQREGRIRDVGVSNVTLPELERARKVVSVVSVQNRYNVLDRESEDVLEYCAVHEIAFLPWFPLGHGKVAAESRLAAIAQRRGASSNQVALAWLLARSPEVLPIPGTLSERHLSENLGAMDLRLTPDDMQELNEMSPPGVHRGG